MAIDEEARWGDMFADDSIFVDGTGKSRIFRVIDDVRRSMIRHEALFEAALLRPERVSRMVLGRSVFRIDPDGYGTQRRTPTPVMLPDGCRLIG